MLNRKGQLGIPEFHSGSIKLGRVMLKMVSNAYLEKSAR